MKQAIPLAVLMVAFLTATNTIAQQLPRARITSIFPAGGQQGTTMEAAIAGGDLEEAKQLFFSHPGITAAPKKDDKGNMVANQYTVAIAKNVPVGIYDVQVGGGQFGISNVRAFAVGDLPEGKSTAGTTAEKAMIQPSAGPIAGRPYVSKPHAWSRKGRPTIAHLSHTGRR